MPYKNDHLSFSRLSRFEQCPLSFKLHYIEEKKAEPNDSLRFGKSIRYKMFNTAKVEHPLDETVRILGDATGRSREDLAPDRDGGQQGPRSPAQEIVLAQVLGQGGAVMIAPGGMIPSSERWHGMSR